MQKILAGTLAALALSSIGITATSVVGLSGWHVPCNSKVAHCPPRVVR